MVAANKGLLREVRRLAIKDELLAMRTRGLLVVPVVALKVEGHGEEGRWIWLPPRRNSRAEKTTGIVEFGPRTPLKSKGRINGFFSNGRWR